MDITLPAFTPIEESLFLTLCGRALDYRSPHSILSDMMADEIVRKLDYDCGRFRLSASPIINIALRAKKLDEVALRFVARYPDAVALDLGAGLDTRMLRIAPTVHCRLVRCRLPRGNHRSTATDTGPRERPRRGYGPDRPRLAGRHPHRPAGRDRSRWSFGVPHPGRHDLATEPSHQPLPQRGGGFQRLLQIRHLGGETLPRNPIRRRPHQVSRLRRPP